ncbi:MAG: hypothetical protein Aurels2KO_04900 [Aureliella sp.]
MFRLPQIALALLLVLAAAPALVGLAISGLTVAAIGWESLVVWCLAGVLAAWLWDRRLGCFNGAGPIVLATLAIAAFVTSLVVPGVNLAATGATLSIMLLCCGLARTADKTSLAGFAAVALPASLAITPSVSMFLNDLVVGWATTTAGDLLHLANIAHITRGDVVTTAIERFSVGYRMQGWATWPVLASLALLYSALMRRNWLHSIAMAATAVPLCVAFHAGAIAMVSASDIWKWELIPTSSWPWISALATAIAMISADRIFELLLKTIEADENASRANPVVHAWNQFVKRPKVSKSQQHKALATFATVSAVALLVLGCMSLPQTTRGIAELGVTRQWNAAPELTTIVKKGQLTGDHFAIDRTIKEQWGRIGDVWLATSADALTELSILQTPPGSSASDVLMGSRWTEVSAETMASEPSRPQPDAEDQSTAPDEAKNQKSESDPSDRPQPPSPEQFELPEMPEGVQIQFLEAANDELSDARSALKDTGHAISFQCALSGGGSVITRKEETPVYWVRLMRRSATKPNSRHAKELAQQLDEILAAIQNSITDAS